LEQFPQGLDNTPHQTHLFNWREDDLRLKPFLKWAGGKSHLLPVLHRCVPKKFGCYFEPFLGGGALFFGLCPENAVLSDSNDELIHCYRIVRDRPEELVERLSKLKVSEEEFYKIRAMRSEVLSAVARAARFIYLNKTCFNGLYRVNKNGLFNTPIRCTPLADTK
jgi:DNA adenine methylase